MPTTTNQQLCIKPTGFLVEYVSGGPFAGPLSADFPDVKKLAGFCSVRYFEFLPQNWQKCVKICCPE